jgi:Protein of unknown function (DUF3572)
MSIHNSPNLPNPEVIALKALGFLAQDGERFQRFLNLTGIELHAIRGAAADPAFLGGVLDHLLGDQTLLLVFAESEDLAPEQAARARRALPGAIA